MSWSARRLETFSCYLLLVTCYPASFDIILSNQRLVKGLSLNLGRSYAATDRCWGVNALVWVFKCLSNAFRVLFMPHFTCIWNFHVAHSLVLGSRRDTTSELNERLQCYLGNKISKLARWECGWPSRNWPLILHLMGWEVGSGFLDQSESEVEQIYSISLSILTLNSY